MQEIHFTNINDLFDHFCQWKWCSYNHHIFRWQWSDWYELAPKALRTNFDITSQKSVKHLKGLGLKFLRSDYWQVLCEFYLLKDFYKICNLNWLHIPNSPSIRQCIESTNDNVINTSWSNANWINDNIIELASIAQHHWIPTRLLDWSFDPYVAMYFAFKSWLAKKWNIAIFILDRFSLKAKIAIPNYNLNPNLNAQKWVMVHIPTKIDDLSDDTKTNVAFWDNLTTWHDKAEIIKLTLPCLELEEWLEVLNRMWYNEAKMFPWYDWAAQCVLNN